MDLDLHKLLCKMQNYLIPNIIAKLDNIYYLYFLPVELLLGHLLLLELVKFQDDKLNFLFFFFIIL